MILVCGEALVDLFVFGQNGPRLAAEAVAGGSPYNVAIGLARLGCPSAFCGGLSTDRFGELLTGQLELEGVALDHAVRKAELTTISVVATDAHGVPLYSFHGEGAADRSITAADLKIPLPDSIEAITIGSYSLGVEPSGSAYYALASRESRRRVVSLDPNIRPTVIGDPRAYPDKLARFLQAAAIVKASAEDVELLYGRGTALADVARSWLRAGPRLVVLTSGADGAVAWFGDDSLEVRGRKVDVVDTVGAGDTFHAALLAHLRKTGDLTTAAVERLGRQAIGRALEYAAAAAAVTCSRRGADMPRAGEVEVLLETA